MAGTVQRLVRRIWGTIASPKVPDNKQVAFNEGDNGSGRDRTQMIAKGPTGTSHVYITVQEIEDYVASAVNTNVISDNVYVTVSSESELDEALESSFDIAIMAIDYCNFSSTKTLDIIANKRIYALSNDFISIDNSVTITFNFDSTGGRTEEIYCDFHSKINGQYDFGGNAAINSSGGVSGVDDRLRFFDLDRIFINSVTGYATVYFENTNLRYPYNDTNATFDLWTKTSNSGRRYAFEEYHPVESHVFGDTDYDHIKMYTGAITPGYTSPYMTLGATDSLMIGSSIDGSGLLQNSYLGSYIGGSGLKVFCWNNGKASQSGLVSLDPWHSDWKVKQISDYTSVCGFGTYTVIANNCYNNTSPTNIYDGWRSANASELGYLIVIKNGVEIKYKADSTASVDAAIYFTQDDYGPFIPSTSNYTNVSSVTIYSARWQKVGKSINVNFVFDLTPTSTGFTLFTATLPFSVSLGSIYDLSGSVNYSYNPSDGHNSDGVVLGNTTYNEASISMNITTTGTKRFSCSYNYELP